MIELKNLTKSFVISKKDAIVLDNISYKFPEKGLVVLLGRSVSGKSTLLNLLAFDDKDYQGNIFYDSVSAKDLNENYVKDNIIYITAENNLLPYLTVKENLKLILQDKYEESQKYIDKYYLNEILNKKVSTLSSGETQKVALIIAIIKKAKITILDEPIRNIEVNSASLFVQEIAELGKETLVICVSHFEKDFKDKADVLLRLEEGKLQEEKNQVQEGTKKTSEEKANKVISYSFKNYKKNKLIPLAFHIIIYALIYVLIFLCYAVTVNKKAIIDVSLKDSINYFYGNENFTNDYQCVQLVNQYDTTKPRQEDYIKMIIALVNDNNVYNKIDVNQLVVTDSIYMNGEEIKLENDTLYCSDYLINEVLKYNETKEKLYAFKTVDYQEPYELKIFEYDTDYEEYQPSKDENFSKENEIYEQRINAYYSKYFVNKETFNKIAPKCQLESVYLTSNNQRYSFSTIRPTSPDAFANVYKIENDNECLLDPYYVKKILNIDMPNEEYISKIYFGEIKEINDAIGREIQVHIEENGKVYDKTFIFKGASTSTAGNSSYYCFKVSENAFHDILESLDMLAPENLYEKYDGYQIDFNGKDYKKLVKDLNKEMFFNYMGSSKIANDVEKINAVKPYVIMGFLGAIVVIAVVYTLYYFAYLKSDWEKMYLLRHKGFNKKEIMIYNYFPTIFIHLFYIAAVIIAFACTKNILWSTIYKI